MKRAWKIWMAVAACLLLAGMSVFVGCMTALKWDFHALSAEELEINEYEIADGFDHIRVTASTADIVLAPSDDGTCRVLCREEPEERYEVAVQNGTLTIRRVDERRWYHHIQLRLFSFDSPQITVYLPEAEYASLVIKASTGDVTLPRELRFQTVDLSLSTGDVSCRSSVSERIAISSTTGKIDLRDLSAGSVELTVTTGRVTAAEVACRGELAVHVSTGSVYLQSLTCESLVSGGDTGEISLENVIASRSFRIERTTGRVGFDGCDAAEIFVETSTGDVAGSLLSEKVFAVHTNTGDVEVPSSQGGGRCEIETSTGDVRITLKK